jgi:hypothetical protein
MTHGHGSIVVNGGGFHNEDVIKLAQCDVHDKTFCSLSDLQSHSFRFAVPEGRKYVFSHCNGCSDTSASGKLQN